MIHTDYIISVKQDWQAQSQAIVQRRQRVAWVIPLLLFAMLVTVWMVQHSVKRLVFQAILTDGLGWGIALGAAVWYTLRYRPKHKRIAVLSGIYIAMIFFIVNVIPKWDLNAWPPQDNLNAPILYWGMWHLMFWLLIGWLMRHYPKEMRAAGLSFHYWRRDILAGLLGGGVLAGHFLFSVAFTGSGELRIPPLPYIVWQMSFEIVATLSTELFFRGVIYRYLESEWHLSYWLASALSAIATVSLFLVKVRWSSDVVTIIGVLFYVMMLSLINSALYRWTRSLLPGYVAALVFHFTAMLR